MIIDCHLHLNKYQDPNQPALPSALEELQAEMKKNKVDYALVLSSYKVNPARPSIDDLVKATRDIKNIAIVAGISFLDDGINDIFALREYMQEGLVKGIKYYCGYEPFYPYEKSLWHYLDLAKEFDVPLMVHSGDTYSPTGKLKYAHPLHIDELAVDHPELNIVICHLGNPWIRDTMEVVYKNKNVYTDMSGLVLGNFNNRFQRFMKQQIHDMLLFGVSPSKLLYGTDWPISSMSSYLDFVDSLKMPREDKRKVLCDNAAKLYNIDTSQFETRKSLLSSRILSVGANKQ